MVSKEFFEKQILEVLGPLHGVARRLTGSEADAEDLVAETVSAAWKARGSLQDDAAFKGWVFKILNNRFISDCRKANARPSTEPIDEHGADLEFSIFEQMHQPFLLWFSNPEQEFIDKLLRADIEQALDKLPEHHRVIVVLADLQEFSYAEIAETLDIPVGTVRSRLARARAALQKSLWQQANAYGLQAGDQARCAESVNESPAAAGRLTQR